MVWWTCCRGALAVTSLLRQFNRVPKGAWWRRPPPQEEEEERVAELAEMLGGRLGGEGARRNAEELIAGAAAWKQAADERRKLADARSR